MELFLPLLVIMEQLLDRWNIRPQNDVGDIDVSASMTSQKIVRDDTYGFTVDSNGNVIAHDQQRDRDFDEPLQEQTAFGRVLNSTYSFVGALFNPSQNNSDDANAPGGGPNDGEFAAATVVAEKDCVVYYWSFKRLRSLMEQYPTMGLAFERLMSGDLNKKMVTTMQVEPVQRYQLLISAALMDGEVVYYLFFCQFILLITSNLHLEIFIHSLIYLFNVVILFCSLLNTARRRWQTSASSII